MGKYLMMVSFLLFLSLSLNTDKPTTIVIWYLFEQSNRFFTSEGKNQIVGSSVKSMAYVSGCYGSNFTIRGDFIKSDGIMFFCIERTYPIPYFPGLKDVDDLPVKPMTSHMLHELMTRGQHFRKLALGHHYLQYKNFMFMKYSNSHVSYFKADGRVMVDIGTYNQINMEYTSFYPLEQTVEEHDDEDYFPPQDYDCYEDYDGDIEPKVPVKMFWISRKKICTKRGLLLQAGASQRKLGVKLS
eukprot:TRINITY_DN5262_c0_g1_i1.p1 TRINITY_DN5262_c0_g1~~TRINITY_DN5262_c0_g1_i1.p1  ORF type:complete len:242 (-),score=19.10 TRINITY_DN5262_c0_g1_i1:388-1113(-)